MMSFSVMILSFSVCLQGLSIHSAAPALLFTYHVLFRPLYPLELSLKEKIETICTEIYGAAKVEYSDQAEQRLAVSVCMCMACVLCDV